MRDKRVPCEGGYSALWSKTNPSKVGHRCSWCLAEGRPYQRSATTLYSVAGVELDAVCTVHRKELESIWEGALAA